MLNKENQDLCWNVLARYGCEHQLGMVIEECAELQKAVCKLIRDDGHITDEHDENFREELVDVLVMLEQMFLVLKMSNDDIDNRANRKLKKALGVQ